VADSRQTRRSGRSEVLFLEVCFEPPRSAGVTQFIVAIYAAVKRTMKAMKWLVFLAAIVLMFYVDEFGDYLKNGLFAENFILSLFIFFLVLLGFASAFWGLYYLLERLSGYQGSFSQFFSENVPGHNWMPQNNNSKEAKNKKPNGKV
jgi:hypothetical protein